MAPVHTPITSVDGAIAPTPKAAVTSVTRGRGLDFVF